MKKCTFPPSILAKWLYQNGGEVVDAIEGCLLDSLLIETRRGTAALLETYVNPWQSTYTLYFSTDSAPVVDLFEERKAANDAYCNSTL